MDLIIFIILTSWATCGIFLSAQEGMIFFPVTKYFEANEIRHTMYPKNIKYIAINFLSKPLIMCPTCMSSVWGVTFFWCYFGELNITTIFCIFILAYTNSVFIELYYKFRNN